MVVTNTKTKTMHDTISSEKNVLMCTDLNDLLKQTVKKNVQVNAIHICWFVTTVFLRNAVEKRLEDKSGLGKTCCTEVGPAAGQLVEMQRFEVWLNCIAYFPLFINSTLVKFKSGPETWIGEQPWPGWEAVLFKPSSNYIWWNAVFLHHDRGNRSHQSVPLQLM